MRFGLDLDGVCYDFHGCYRYIANHYLGAKLPPVDEFWTYWDAPYDYLDKSQRQWMWTEGVTTYGLFRHGKILKGAREFLRELHTLADIVVLTHRPSNAVQDTIDWLSFHKIPATEVHILSSNQNKADIVCDMYLDDKIQNVINFMEAGKVGLLWNRPWNQTSDLYLVNHIQRVYSWAEVLERCRTFHARAETG